MAHLLSKIIIVIFLVCTCTHISLASNSHIFTVKEKEWLRDHPHIRLLVSTSIPSISMWDDSFSVLFKANQISRSEPENSSVHPNISFSEKNGHSGFQGVAAEYLLDIAKITGISFTATYFSGSSHGAISDAFQKGEADLLPALMLGPSDISKLHLTDTYISVPVVVVMKSDASSLADLTTLNSLKVAGEKSIQKKLDSLGLRVKLHHLSLGEGLKGVATGSYDAYLSGLADLSHELAHTTVGNLKIVGNLPDPFEFSMVVAPQIKEFVPILNKSIKVISEERKKEIWEKWFSITYEKKYSASSWLWGFGLSSIFALMAIAAGFSYYRGNLSKGKSHTKSIESDLLCVHTDDNTTITGVSKRFCEVTGFQNDYLVGKPFLTVSKKALANQSTLEVIFESARKDKSWQGEIELTKNDGTELFTDVVICTQRRKNDRSEGFTIIYQDAPKRKHDETLAIRDELTGLYNKVHFNIMSPILLKQAYERKFFFGMFLVEVDNFKEYKNKYGDVAGNEVLISIGDSLRDILQRDEDLCFRLGGEEFSVVTLFGDAEGATNIARKILTSIVDLKIEYKGTSGGVVTVSIGIRVVTGGYRGDIDTIYQQADKALYEAKASGGDRFIGFDGRTEL